MSSSGGPMVPIWKKWSMTHRLVRPASSELRAIRPKVGPIDAGASGQLKYDTCEPSLMPSSCAPHRAAHNRVSSVAGELAVGHPVRAGRVGTEPLDLVRLIGLEVALEPVPLGGVLVVALVGEDVRRDPVEEPPVVTDDHRAARELEQRVLERA